MMRHLLTYLISALFLFGCVDNNETKALEELRNCINNNLSEDLEKKNGKSKIDFYQFTSAFEQKMIELNVINKNNQTSYIELFKSITKQNQDFNNLYEQSNSIIEEFGFDSFSTEIIFNKCLYEISKDKMNQGGNFIYKQGKLLNEMIAQGFNNFSLLENFILVLDSERFENIIYRAPVILLVMINLDIKYDKDKWKKIELGNGTN